MNTHTTAPRRSFAVCNYCGFTNSTHAQRCPLKTPTPARERAAAARAEYEFLSAEWGRAYARLNDEAAILGKLYAYNAPQASLDGQLAVVRELDARANAARDAASAALMASQDADELAGIQR